MQEQKKYSRRAERAGADAKAAAGAGARLPGTALGSKFGAAKFNSKIIASEAIRGLAYVGASYLLGSCRMFFGTYPLGLSLLCAADVKLPFILIGLAASAFPATPYPALYISAYVVALLLRIITRVFIDTADGREEYSSAARIKWFWQRIFSESVSLRMTAAAVCAFIIGLYNVIAGGYRYYDLLGAVISIAAAPLFVWMFCGWFKGERGTTKARYLAGVALLAAALCYSARDLNIMGISLTAFGAFFFTLYIGRKNGILSGAAAGLICGVAYNPLYAPLFVLAAIADGLLAGVSSTLAASAAFASGMLWGLYIEGFGALSGLLPGLLLSSAAFCGFERAGLFSKKSAPALCLADDRAVAEADMAKARISSDETRLRAVSESFASLAEVFYNLSDRLRRPGIIDLRRVCDKNFDRACGDCAKREICWGLEYGSSLDMITTLCAGLHEYGKAEIDSLPESVRRRCTQLPEIIDGINAGCASLTRAVFRSEKMGIFALDYDAMSRILSDALEEQRADYDRAGDYEGKVGGALERLGLVPEVLFVYGKRKKYISARKIACTSAKLDSGAVRSALEAACGCALEDPLIEPVPDGGQTLLSMTLSTRRKYAVERAVTSAAATGSDGVCGDSICTFENDRDYFYALISDGMGTGSSAAFSSGISSLFLEKMLTAGNRTTTALKMLNGVLRSRGGERDMEYSATVDLLEIDLLTGEASLIKSGAAPTFIRRRGDIFRLHSKTVPIGILTALDAQQTKLEVSAGDVIVMVSDGISDAPGAVCGGESGWLPDLLALEWEDNLPRMAKKIIGRAQGAGSVDDLSVVVIKVIGSE